LNIPKSVAYIITMSDGRLEDYSVLKTVAYRNYEFSGTTAFIFPILRQETDFPDGKEEARMTSGFDPVAKFILTGKAEDVPLPVRKRAALLALDTIGIIAAAGPMEAGRIARDAACALYGSSETGYSVRMMFDGRKVSLAGAAYAAATQTDNLDAHDGYNPNKGHIGVVVIPALVALSETVKDFSGPEALAHIVTGYEVAARAGTVLHATVSDYHTSGAWNALAAAAMAARMRKLDAGQLREALGIAEFHGPRSQMMREIAHPTMLHDGSGWGALAGLSAAILAEKGFTGAPAITVESPDVADYWGDLGERWLTEEQYIKPYPICRWAHAAIDATRKLMAAHDVLPNDIEHIRVNSFHEAACLYAGIPDTTSQAQYSLPFAVAVMAVHGRIGLEHISGDGMKDSQVADMHSRISVCETQKHNDRFPLERWADAEIRLRDGTIFHSGDVPARGGAEEPFAEQDYIDKYHEYADPVLGRARAERIRNAILALTEPDSRFSDLSAHLFDPGLE
jgi:2-methylcitrate dehydratase PrpD